jgi:hypothetical protein
VSKPGSAIQERERAVDVECPPKFGEWVIVMIDAQVDAHFPRLSGGANHPECRRHAPAGIAPCCRRQVGSDQLLDDLGSARPLSQPPREAVLSASRASFDLTARPPGLTTPV